MQVPLKEQSTRPVPLKRLKQATHPWYCCTELLDTTGATVKHLTGHRESICIFRHLELQGQG